MSETIIVALLSLFGTILGTFGGILTTNKLISYKIEQLEKKVEKHNQVIERVYELEKHEAVVDTEIKSISHQIEEITEHN